VWYAGYFPGGYNPACPLPNVGYVNSFIRRVAAALPSMARALGVAIDPQWQDIALHQVPLPTARINGTDLQVFTTCDTNETVPNTQRTTTNDEQLHSGTSSMPSLAWCRSKALNPWTVHPGEGVHLGDDQITQKIARRSYENISEVVGLNNLCSSFNGAVRIGVPAAEVLAGFRRSSRPCGGKTEQTCKLPNGLYYQNGGVEIAGASEFVNSMLMQSVTAHDGSGEVTTMVFPNWVLTEDAAFFQLRARGAFLISANFSSMAKQVVSPITVLSEAGQLCRLRNPWPGKPQNQVEVRDLSTGNNVEVAWRVTPAAHGDVMSFETRRGATYAVATVPATV